MLTQEVIAQHLDLGQSTVSELMAELKIDWRTSSMRDIRVAYIRRLRHMAPGHRSNSGADLVATRVRSEELDQRLKELQIAEKEKTLINVGQFEPELMNMMFAFRTELLARDDKLKDELDARYGINIELEMLNQYTRAALTQLGRYNPDERDFSILEGDPSCL